MRRASSGPLESDYCRIEITRDRGARARSGTLESDYCRIEIRSSEAIDASIWS